MGFFDLINPFSYVTPVHADDAETEEAAAVIVSESVDEPAKEDVSKVQFVASDPVEEESTDEETEAEEEDDTVEEEEEEDAVDPADKIKEECGETLHCRSLKHHLEECAARVEDGSKESCAEEFLHFLHCVDKCAVPQIFAKFNRLTTGSAPLFAAMVRPPLSRSFAGRRFLAAATTMRYYVPGVGPVIKRLVNGKLLMSLLSSIFSIARAGLRLPVMLLTSAIASLAYIEYKLSQMNAPDWVTGGLGQARGWLEGLHIPDWLRIASSDSEKDRAEVDKAVGSRDSWGTGVGSSGSGYNDPVSGGGGSPSPVPPPTGGYYTSPDPNPSSQEVEYREQPSAQQQTPRRDSPSDNNELMELTKRLLEIQTILKTVKPSESADDNGDEVRHSSALQLPSIVVIGSQSSGKSSVLEAIVGQEFLPKGSNMVTRRPIELTLINTPEATEEYGEFPQLGLGRIDDFRHIQRTLHDLNMAVPETECVSDKPIELRIYSPHVPDLRLVDLPGYIQVVNRKQPPVLRQKIRDLCEGYLRQPNIILAVCAADVDLANSEALKASRRNDPMGTRTIGVITKVDMAEPDMAVHMLTQNDYPLHLGYIGVVCKPVKEKAGRTSHEILLSESQYFGRHAEFQQPGLQVGVGTLRRKLVRVLEESMRRSLSSLVDAVRSELEETRYQIKVQYNDERVSPESYMAESLDSLKQRFKAFQQQFGKPQLRAEVQRWLESRVMDVCAELYWSNPAIGELSNHVTRSRAAGWLADIRTKSAQVATTAANIVSELLAADTAKEQKGPQLNRVSIGEPTARQSSSASGGKGKGSNNGQAPSEWGDEDDAYWDHQLDRASALLTKSGVGRWTTQMVVDLLMNNVTSMIDAEPFVHHPETREMVLSFSQAILRSKYHSTVDQVENTIKPFKYEVEVEQHEWAKAQKRSGALIENEIRLCRQALTKLRSSTPKKQLQQAMQFVAMADKRGLDPIAVQVELARRNAEHSTTSPEQPLKPETSAAEPATQIPAQSTSGNGESDNDALDDIHYAQYSPRLLRRAQQVLMIQDRLSILHLRRKALSSSTCGAVENKRLCPEIFLDVVAEKLAYNAVMFINFELLQDFFFQFPRELDSNLYYGKSAQQIRDFASQNPRIGKQLVLLERRMRLELVMSRLQDLVRQQVATETGGHGRRSVATQTRDSPFSSIRSNSDNSRRSYSGF
ncbi:mitochondrial dynamin GTPase Msp1 [Coemansia sp. S146]|nr:mitochondrial dynamin GTPase Msp1 [Coemansia sp. S146]